MGGNERFLATKVVWRRKERKTAARARSVPNIGSGDEVALAVEFMLDGDRWWMVVDLDRM